MAKPALMGWLAQVALCLLTPALLQRPTPRSIPIGVPKPAGDPIAGSKYGECSLQPHQCLVPFVQSQLAVQAATSHHSPHNPALLVAPLPSSFLLLLRGSCCSSCCLQAPTMVAARCGTR